VWPASSVLPRLACCHPQPGLIATCRCRCLLPLSEHSADSRDGAGVTCTNDVCEPDVMGYDTQGCTHAAATANDANACASPTCGSVTCDASCCSASASLVATTTPPTCSGCHYTMTGGTGAPAALQACCCPVLVIPCGAYPAPFQLPAAKLKPWYHASAAVHYSCGDAPWAGAAWPCFVERSEVGCADSGALARCTDYPDGCRTTDTCTGGGATPATCSYTSALLQLSWLAA
jgi:hypothetical protein